MSLGGGGSSQPESTTTTSVTELPDWIEPHAQKFLSKANYYADNKNADWIFRPYQGPRTAGLTGEHEAGMGAAMDQATYGFPGQELAEAEYAKTLRGDYLDPESNPYLADTFNAAARNVADQYMYGTVPQMTASAVRNRSMGNAGQAQYEDMQRFGFGENLNNLATNIYGPAYAMERGNMQSAMQFAPAMQEMGYRDAQTQLGIGDIRRDYAQSLINEDIMRDAERRQVPLQRLDLKSSAIQAALGGGARTTMTAPSYFNANPTTGMLGGGMMGYLGGNAYANSGGPSWSPYAGAALGGLGGYMLS
jgi:hypothetical protein